MCERSVLQLEEYVGYDVEERVVEEGGVVVVFSERERERRGQKEDKKACDVSRSRGGGVWCVVCGGVTLGTCA